MHGSASRPRVDVRVLRQLPIPHVRSGKLVVAHDEQEIQQLEALQRRGTENGVAGSQSSTAPSSWRASRRQHHLPVVPRQRHRHAEELVKALLKAAEEEGVIFLPGTKLVGADRPSEGMTLQTERETISRARSVNAAACIPTRCRGARRRDLHDLSGRENTRSSTRPSARWSTR